MLVFTDNIRSLIVCGLILGGVLCLLYDIIRASRDFLGISSDISKMKSEKFFAAKAVYLFLTDFFFCIVSAICMLFLAYFTNGGVFRGLVLACVSIGFIIIRLTLSKLFMFLLLKLSWVINRLLRLLFRVLRFILAKIAKPVFSVYHLTLGRIVCIIKDRIKKKRELRAELKKRAGEQSGKENNVILQEALEDGNKKERIFIGRRA